MKHGVILHNGPVSDLQPAAVAETFQRHTAMFRALWLHGWRWVPGGGWYRRGIVLNSAAVRAHWDNLGYLPDWAV